ncbi:hypothetical protein G6F57_017384 [Rhizopus arrhizus]|nr:hypothetical protein G6F57_017384 [Rhizopus arrhizus]
MCPPARPWKRGNHAVQRSSRHPTRRRPRAGHVRPGPQHRFRGPHRSALFLLHVCAPAHRRRQASDGAGGDHARHRPRLRGIPRRVRRVRALERLHRPVPAVPRGPAGRRQPRRLQAAARRRHPLRPDPAGHGG